MADKKRARGDDSFEDPLRGFHAGLRNFAILAVLADEIELPLGNDTLEPVAFATKQQHVSRFQGCIRQ